LDDHARSDALTHQCLVPTLDDLTDADREGRRLRTAVGAVEGLVTLVDLADVVRDQGLARLDLLALAVDELRDLELAVRRGGALEVELRHLAVLEGNLRDPAGRIDLGA